jgi:hypothetical protein
MPSMQLGGISPRRAECPIFAEREMLVKTGCGSLPTPADFLLR